MRRFVRAGCGRQIPAFAGMTVNLFFIPAKAGISGEDLVQYQRMVDVARAGRSQNFHVGHFYLVKRAVDFPFPESQEFVRLGKFGGQIKRLSDIGLQQVQMIGKAIDDFGSGKAVTAQLTLDIGHKS